MVVKGTIQLKHMYAGSKSEGIVTFLLTDENKEYRLYRPDVYAINDEYFFPFEEKTVSIEGIIDKTADDEDYIIVSSIEEIHTDKDSL